MRFALEAPRQNLRIENVPLASRSNSRPCSRTTLDHALRGEGSHSLPISRSGDAQIIARLDLAPELKSGRPLTADDFYADRAGNGAVNARRRASFKIHKLAPEYERVRYTPPTRPAIAGTRVCPLSRR